jgi:hypothetical protein
MVEGTTVPPREFELGVAILEQQPTIYKISELADSGLLLAIA